MPLCLLFVILASTGSWPGQVPTPSPTPTPTPWVEPTAVVTPSPEPTPDAAALLALADERYSRRSIGAIDEVAHPREIDGAIDLYRMALALEPGNIDILARLMRALHFRGAYTGAPLEEKKAIFDEGRQIGQAAVDRLEAEARQKMGMSRIEALRLVKGAPALYLWTAGHWGEWALTKGKFAAARSGVASRLRDLAQTVIEIDPFFEDAAGYRILGRLHSEAPSIIFITGWVSHDKALQYLRRAHQLAPHHPATCYFLAEAILDHEPAKRDEAIALLQGCAAIEPRPDFILEDTRYARVAQKKLDELRPATGR